MKPLDPLLVDLLQSIRSWCLEVETLIHEHDEALFETSRLHELALTKGVEQVGELAGRVLKKHPDFAAEAPDLDLLPAYLMRHRLVHGYQDVIMHVVVGTAKVDIPAMRLRLEEILRDAGEDFA